MPIVGTVGEMYIPRNKLESEQDGIFLVTSVPMHFIEVTFRNIGERLLIRAEMNSKSAALLLATRYE